MKNLNKLDKYRIKHPLYGDTTGNPSEGVFMIPCPTGRTVAVIATTNDEWDHISVSLKKYTPNYQEMDFIKRMFFNPDECVVQYHVPESDHINLHPNCLHLWRPQKEEILRPPNWMVI